MGFKPWKDIPFGDQVEIIMGCVELTEEQQLAVFMEWENGVYEDTYHGHQQSLADLLQMARLASMSDQQRQEERRRLSRS
jgi:hypothetical protein